MSVIEIEGQKAKFYGGGGHPVAAGFASSQLIK
ncbi:hypothetical protein LCGC14_1748040 [marine sediment metagenome]|uniref:Uncharacterized protein n=1 Tax=marine sediment metagenome TaxID=412755 RepID=A0A0F9H4Q1_9ZZZZ